MASAVVGPGFISAGVPPSAYRGWEDRCPAHGRGCLPGMRFGSV